MRSEDPPVKRGDYCGIIFVHFAAGNLLRQAGKAPLEIWSDWRCDGEFLVGDWVFEGEGLGLE
jgi:hypothetical protein